MKNIPTFSTQVDCSLDVRGGRGLRLSDDWMIAVQAEVRARQRVGVGGREAEREGKKILVLL